MSTFNLPDLGEGLREAEIREWHVAEGDTVEKEQALVSVETDKAIVDIPSPRVGVVIRLHGQPDDIIQVGDALVEFDGADDTQPSEKPHEDGGAVVGEVESTDKVIRDDAKSISRGAQGLKATPAVRALAQRLGVDLAVVTPTGKDSLITRADVERAASVLTEAGPLEPLRGPRRAMARAMATAHAEVVPATVTEDADVDAWDADANATLRLIHAIAAGCRAEPALNAWFDGDALGRRLVQSVHLGIAVDTIEGLFVPVLRDVAGRDSADLLQGLEALKRDVRERSIPPEELRGHTFTLSNYGNIGGRYAAPVVTPPTVAILGAGRIREAVVAAGGEPAVRRILPLSLTFDHRAVTGGEASRFLMAAIADLEAPE
jgi:pyruvate dehydrogenase E2 component (dihydrolipoamide acetyltransferase)